MAKNRPGKTYRKRLSAIDITKMFPDDETARKWFEETVMAERSVLPQVRYIQRAIWNQAQDNDAPMP